MTTTDRTLREIITDPDHKPDFDWLRKNAAWNDADWDLDESFRVIDLGNSDYRFVSEDGDAVIDTFGQSEPRVYLGHDAHEQAKETPQ